MESSGLPHDEGFLDEIKRKPTASDSDLFDLDPSSSLTKDLTSDDPAVTETNRFLDELMSDAMTKIPIGGGETFDKPLPPEPATATADFLNFESDSSSQFKPSEEDLISDFLGKPKDLPHRDDTPEPYEPSQTPEPEVKPDPPREPTPPPVPAHQPPVPAHQPPSKPTPEKPVSDSIGAKDIRGKLDAWFNPARLHPKVESLIYWRDPKKSGIVFGVILVSLLALIWYSLISVVAYLGLFSVAGTVSFRVYKSVMQAIQKTSEGHPFKDLLEVDLSVPEDKVTEVSHNLARYINTGLSTLRSLVLVEDIIDSSKFLVLLWALTYIGAYFNGLTLIILGHILLFTVPKVYENNKAQIDVYVKMAMDKLSIITNKMKAAVPEGKKEEKKDQ